MSKVRNRCSVLLILLVFSSSFLLAGARIVVLGSSTAAGSGPVNKANAWVARYTTYLRSLDVTHVVSNLAKGSYVTFQAMPSWYVPPAGVTYLPDSLRNITKALSLSPDAIIINFPSNDISMGISIDQQITNYNVMIAEAAKKDVPVWICTSQPVNYGSNQSARDKIKALKERIQTEYNDMSIDFYTGICDSYGKILSEYDSGDGLHLNDLAHKILFERVVSADILTRIGYDPEENPGAQLFNPVLVDFGAVASVSPWNSLTNANLSGIGSEIDNLSDVTGESTGVGLRVSKSFYGMNTYGASVTNTSLEMPGTASSDNFYTGGGFGELLLTGLNPNQLLTFVFFGSRMEQGGLSRETKYTVRGNNVLSGTLETHNNSSDVLVLDKIQPASDKSLSIEVTYGPGNLNPSKYSHLSAMKIYPESISSVEQEKIQSFKLWKEYGKTYASFTGNGKIVVYNLMGELVYSRAFCSDGFIDTVELSPPVRGMLIVIFKSDSGDYVKKVLFT